MSEIHVARVTKEFGDFTAVAKLDIRFTSGEVTCLLGPSGCGKTTLMRMIAGLETPTDGRIHMGGKDVTDLPPRKRNISMVFQYPVMYQTLSVRENIVEPFRKDRSIDAAQRERRVSSMIELLDMRGMEDAYIEDLDAGLRQKVAVGRALARQTEVVLFDEPTASMEINTKLNLIRALKEITSRLNQTIIYVTHDQTEAMTLADRIALMRDGEIVQYASPRELYSNPASTFGGWFLGNPGMNFLPAVLADGKLSSPLLAEPMVAPERLPSTELSIGVRPEHIKVVATAQDSTVNGRLLERTIGIAGRQLLRVSIGDSVVVVKTSVNPDIQLGEEIHLAVAHTEVALFAAGKRVSL